MSIISDEIRQRQNSLIDAWVTDLRVHDKADATITVYGDVVRRAHAALRYGIAGSTTEELQAWIWTPGRAPASRKLYRAAIASFFAWAADHELIDFDSARLLPAVRVRPGAPRPTGQDDLADILAHARDPIRVWILLAAAMGLRCVEIARLDREHITEEQTWVQGKGGLNVFTPTHPIIWLAVQNLPPGPIATRKDGSRATRKDVYSRANVHIRRILGHAGVTMHRMRHWHGTQIYRSAGRDILVAKAALRHASVAMTQRYVEGDDPAHIAALQALPLPI